MRAALAGLLSLYLALTAAVEATGAERTPADVIIRGGTVYTGTTRPFVGDVVVTGGTISYVGPDGGRLFAAGTVIDAFGKIVAPGFIDAHTHPDTYIRSDDARQRLNAPWLMQGVTTILIGVDGGGSPDVASEAAEFSRRGVGTNLVPYVGFSAVRQRVLQQSARAPS